MCVTGLFRLGVVRDIRVQQQDRHAPNLDEPDGGEQVAPGELHRDSEGIAVLPQDSRDRQLGQVVVRICVLLVAVRVDRLAEVAVLVQETHAHERHGHVAGRLDVVAGENAQSAE